MRWLSLSPFSAASEIYFLVLVTFAAVRTLWGTGLGVAMVAALVGLAATSRWPDRVPSVGPVHVLPGVAILAVLRIYSAWLRSALFGRGPARAPASAPAVGHRDHQSPRRRRAVSAWIDLPAAPSIRRSQATIRARRWRSIAREADPVFQLGRIALEEERLDDAIELLTRAGGIGRQMLLSRSVAGLGRRVFRSGRLEEARVALSQVRGAQVVRSRRPLLVRQEPCWL